MFTRWTHVAAMLAIVGVAVVAFSPKPQVNSDAAVFERLAGRIERTKSLSAETKDTVMRLVVDARQRQGSADPAQEARRTAAIERLANALKAKLEMSNPTSIGLHAAED
jgi:16S rRNA A1518/A1519 N6-dimethyltransferase RsmA/KsgA/DIM1 with predicted DNA glycosylase/AP lyase activity